MNVLKSLDMDIEWILWGGGYAGNNLAKLRGPSTEKKVNAKQI